MWQADAVGLGSRDRGIGDALERDLAALQSGTFSVAVPDGVYEVTVYAGDMVYHREQMAVTIEGTQYALPDTSAGR